MYIYSAQEFSSGTGIEEGILLWQLCGYVTGASALSKASLGQPLQWGAYPCRRTDVGRGLKVGRIFHLDRR